jgi:histidine racemase
MPMRISGFLIAGGNATALVLDAPLSERPTLLAKLLARVEQVGFISLGHPRPSLRMMGGEFCINATLAFASTLGQSGEITVSGLSRPVWFRNNGPTTTISVPMHWSRDDNIVLLEGIGFILHAWRKPSSQDRVELSTLCARHDLPAFGAIFYQSNRITPLVHVAEVNSWVEETACGSGSVAFSLYSGISEVLQPSGESITVHGRDPFQISARVTPLSL